MQLNISWTTPWCPVVCHACLSAGSPRHATGCCSATSSLQAATKLSEAQLQSQTERCSDCCRRWQEAVRPARLSAKNRKEALGFCHRVQSWCKHDPIGKQGAPGMILPTNHAWTNAGRRKASLSRRTINRVLYNKCVKIFGKVSKELPALSWLTKKWFWRKTSSEQEQKYTSSVGFAEGLHPSCNQSLSGIWSVTPMRVDSRSLLTSVTELGWENPSVKTGFWSSV